MIVIDGRQSAISLSNFANLEEVLINLMENEGLDERVVTDVKVNGEAFSELYPHQAEDIDSSSISTLELSTVSAADMAGDMVQELPKVVDIMASGSRAVAGLLRRAELSEALELLQDTIHVSRDFLTTIQVLRHSFAAERSIDLDTLGEVLGGLLGEISDAMANEDWLLAADLLEYEYQPACEGWRGIIAKTSAQIAGASA